MLDLIAFVQCDENPKNIILGLDRMGFMVYNDGTNKEEVTKMTHIDFDTYQLICELLDNEDLGLDDIAVMAGVSLADVQYVDRAENDIM